MNLKNLKPTGNRLLIERQKTAEVVTEGGIILTPGLTVSGEYSPKGRNDQKLVEKEQEQEDNIYQSQVLEVGPDCKGVKKGDMIITNKYSGIDLFKDRITFLIKEEDVLAIL